MASSEASTMAASTRATSTANPMTTVAASTTPTPSSTTAVSIVALTNLTTRSVQTAMEAVHPDGSQPAAANGRSARLPRPTAIPALTASGTQHGNSSKNDHVGTTDRGVSSCAHCANRCKYWCCPCQAAH